MELADVVVGQTSDIDARWLGQPAFRLCGIFRAVCLRCAAYRLLVRHRGNYDICTATRRSVAVEPFGRFSFGFAVTEAVRDAVAAWSRRWPRGLPPGKTIP